MAPTGERVVSSRLVYDGRIVKFRIDTLCLPDGQVVEREIVGFPGAVAVVPITDEGQIRFVRQYRAPINKDLLEIPAGSLEPGEAPEETARRELAEETGDRATDWQMLTSIYTSPGACDELLHLFLATGLESGEANPEPDEFLEVVTIPLDQALAMTRSGEIKDAKTIIGLTLAAELWAGRNHTG